MNVVTHMLLFDPALTGVAGNAAGAATGEEAPR
jgi:hypothetical protein